MLRTYSLKHNLNVKALLYAYLTVLNAIIHDIWNSVEWKEWQISSKKQKRLFPKYRKDNTFKRELRDKYLKDWDYAAHWVDSALKPAFSIMDSWKKNYDKGKRKRKCPIVKRPFVRVKQTLMKIEGEQLRITIKPREFVYIDLSKRYFKLNGKIGEPILTIDKIHIPIHHPEEANKNKIEGNIGWDFNLKSIDGFSPETGWIRIDTKPLQTIHISSFERRRRLQKKASKSRKVKEILNKTRHREMNRAKNGAHLIANALTSFGKRNGFENLEKEGMFRKYRIWNRKIARTDWRKISSIASYKSESVIINPYHTSKDCSRCGCTNKDLKGEKFECKNCGLIIDRQMNAGINIYLKMGGFLHDIRWFDENIVGGFISTGAKQKDSDELVRNLYDVMKPKFYLSPLKAT